MAQENLNPIDIAQRPFEAAAERLGLDEGLRDVLRAPRRQLVVAVPTLMDDGSVRVHEGYRVQHSFALGPAQGGLRYHPRLNLEESRALAAWTTWACAVAHVPSGGAGGGVACDPKRLSRGELERLTRRFAAELATAGGAAQDVPAPDAGTDSRVIAWLLDTRALVSGRLEPGPGSGKPAALGGAAIRDGAARGVVLGLREASLMLRKPLRGASVAVLGFGSAGGGVARLLHDEGARLVAAADSRGGLYASRGLDPREVASHRQHAGSIAGFKGAERITHDELLEGKCDVLVLAAPGTHVTLRNASRVRARIVAEIANGAISPGAERVLQDRGALILPDLVCGAGAVSLAYLERAGDTRGLAWEEAELAQQLERFSRRAVHEVIEAARAARSDLRSAAWQLAVSRVAAAVRARGLFP